MDIRRAVVGVLLWWGKGAVWNQIGNYKQKDVAVTYMMSLVAVRCCRCVCVHFIWSDRVLCSTKFSLFYLLCLCKSESHYLAQAGIALGMNSLVSTSQGLGLEVYTAISGTSSISSGKNDRTMQNGQYAKLSFNTSVTLGQICSLKVLWQYQLCTRQEVVICC